VCVCVWSLDHFTSKFWVQLVVNN